MASADSRPLYARSSSSEPPGRGNGLEKKFRLSDLAHRDTLQVEEAVLLRLPDRPI